LGTYFGELVGSRAGQKLETVSAALPDFDCLIHTACDHIGGSLVEICKRGKKEKDQKAGMSLIWSLDH